MRIRFTGAHGTGKTTLLKELENFEGISELARNLIEFFGNPKDLDMFDKIVFQRMLLHGQKELNKHYIEQAKIFPDLNFAHDRSLIDILAYTYLLLDENNLELHHSKVIHELIQKIREEILMEEFDLTFYIPIEFDLEDDGVRFTDKKKQKKIDYYIINILEEFQIPIIALTGSVEERLQQIDEAVKKHKKK